MGSLCWLRRWPVKPTQVGVHLHTVGPPLLCPTMGETERSAHLNQATGPSSPTPSCSRSPEGRGLLCGPPVPGGAPLLLVVAQASLLLGSQCTWLSCQHLTADRWTEYPSSFMCGLFRITWPEDVSLRLVLLRKEHIVQFKFSPNFSLLCRNYPVVYFFWLQ